MGLFTNGRDHIAAVIFSTQNIFITANWCLISGLWAASS